MTGELPRRVTFTGAADSAHVAKWLKPGTVIILTALRSPGEWYAKREECGGFIGWVTEKHFEDITEEETLT